MAIDIGTVRGEEITANKDGEDNVRLLQVEFSNPDDLQTIEMMGAPGDDSAPRPGDRVIVVDLGASYRVAIAFEDPVEPSVLPGERLLYSYADDRGVLRPYAQIYLQENGAIEIWNDDGSISMDSNGQIIATNGTATVTVSDSGDITLENTNGIITITESTGQVSVNGGNLTVDV